MSLGLMVKGVGIQRWKDKGKKKSKWIEAQTAWIEEKVMSEINLGTVTIFLRLQRHVPANPASAI